MTDREVCIGCNLISGIGSVRFAKLCEAVDTPAAIRADFSEKPMPSFTFAGHSFRDFPLAFAPIPKEMSSLTVVLGNGVKRKPKLCGKSIICVPVLCRISILWLTMDMKTENR